jgi:hypothetical protein
MEQSLKNRIARYLDHEYPKWIHGGQLEALSMSAGYKASNGSRRCRDLVAEGRIERKENEKGEVLYRYKKIVLPEAYPPKVEVKQPVGMFK